MARFCRSILVKNSLPEYTRFLFYKKYDEFTVTVAPLLFDKLST